MLMGLRVVQLGFRDIRASLVIEVELIFGSYLIFYGLYMSTSNSRHHAIFCFDGKIKMSSSFLNFCVHFFLLFFFNFSHMDTPPLPCFTFYYIFLSSLDPSLSTCDLLWSVEGLLSSVPLQICFVPTRKMPHPCWDGSRSGTSACLALSEKRIQQ